MTSALYHAQLAPTLFTDRDGRYVGLDRQVHQAAKGAEAFSTYSLWDTYPALHPLLTLIDHARAALPVRDICRQTAPRPAGPPVWPLPGAEPAGPNGWPR